MLLQNKNVWATGIAALGLMACGQGEPSVSKSTAEAPAASTATTASSSTSTAATGNLNIYNWSDYVEPKTVTEFEQKYQVKVTQDFYDSNEILEAKLLTGKSGYDLVFPSLSNLG